MTSEFQLASGFWSGGGAYYEGLIQQHEAQIASLRDQLAECVNPAGRDEIRTQIKAAQTEFKAKVKKIRGLLF